MHRIRKYVTFANIIALIALFISLGGTSYAVSRATPPVKFVRGTGVSSAAAYNPDGTLLFSGGGRGYATCPKGYVAVGGGHYNALASDPLSLQVNISSPIANNPAKWLVEQSNYSKSSQTFQVTAVCARASAL